MRKKPSQGTRHGDCGAETAGRQAEVRRTTSAVSKLCRGDKRPVPVAVDLGTGEPFAIGCVNEYDPQATRRRLAPLVQQYGITMIVFRVRTYETFLEIS